jgi:hypothetical protein
MSPGALTSTQQLPPVPVEWLDLRQWPTSTQFPPVLVE